MHLTCLNICSMTSGSTRQYSKRVNKSLSSCSISLTDTVRVFTIPSSVLPQPIGLVLVRPGIDWCSNKPGTIKIRESTIHNTSTSYWSTLVYYFNKTLSVQANASTGNLKLSTKSKPVLEGETSYSWLLILSFIHRVC